MFPPYYVGGYELACRDVVLGLRRRGHQVTVVTSFYGLTRPQMGPKVLRVLWQAEFGSSGIKSWPIQVAYSCINRFILSATVRKIQPQIIVVFSTYSLGALSLDWLHSQRRPVVHDISDDGLTIAYMRDCWFGRPRHISRNFPTALVKNIITTLALAILPDQPAPLDLRDSYFRSSFLRELFLANNYNVSSSPIIYHGIEQVQRLDQQRPGGIIYAGRLEPSKGIHVLLEALGILDKDGRIGGLSISIVGPFQDPEYYARLLRGCLTEEKDGRIRGNPSESSEPE